MSRLKALLVPLGISVMLIASLDEASGLPRLTIAGVYSLLLCVLFLDRRRQHAIVGSLVLFVGFAVQALLAWTVFHNAIAATGTALGAVILGIAAFRPVKSEASTNSGTGETAQPETRR